MEDEANPQPVTEYFTFRDAAAQLGYTERHIHSLKREGKIGFTQFGRRVRFTQAHIDLYRATYLAAIEVPAIPKTPVGTELAT